MKLFNKKPKSFILPISNKLIFEKCEKYGYVNFYISTNKERIIIYAPNCLGGDGEICDLPPKFHKLIIKNKIKKANIIDIQKDHCTIIINN